MLYILLLCIYNRLGTFGGWCHGGTHALRKTVSAFWISPLHVHLMLLLHDVQQQKWCRFYACSDASSHVWQFYPLEERSVGTKQFSFSQRDHCCPARKCQDEEGSGTQGLHRRRCVAVTELNVASAFCRFPFHPGSLSMEVGGVELITQATVWLFLRNHVTNTFETENTQRDVHVFSGEVDVLPAKSSSRIGAAISQFLWQALAMMRFWWWWLW